MVKSRGSSCGGLEEIIFASDVTFARQDAPMWSRSPPTRLRCSAPCSTVLGNPRLARMCGSLLPREMLAALFLPACRAPHLSHPTSVSGPEWVNAHRSYLVEAPTHTAGAALKPHYSGRLGD